MKMKTSAYHKPISVFDEDVSDPAEAFEELLQVTLPDAEWQAADVDAGTHHFLKHQNITDGGWLPPQVGHTFM